MTANKSALDDFIENVSKQIEEYPMLQAGSASVNLVLDLARAIRNDLEAIKQGRDNLSPPLKGDSVANKLTNNDIRAILYLVKRGILKLEPSPAP